MKYSVVICHSFVSLLTLSFFAHSAGAEAPIETLPTNQVLLSLTGTHTELPAQFSVANGTGLSGLALDYRHLFSHRIGLEARVQAQVPFEDRLGSLLQFELGASAALVATPRYDLRLRAMAGAQRFSDYGDTWLGGGADLTSTYWLNQVGITAGVGGRIFQGGAEATGAAGAETRLKSAALHLGLAYRF